MLAPYLQEFWRSHLPSQCFRKEDVWNAWPLQHDLVDDYLFPGTYLDTNPPYWALRTCVHQRSRETFQVQT